MEQFGPMNDSVLLLLAQQGGPTDGHREAYEGGRKIGEITFYAMVAAILVWGLVKLFKRR
jgi:hypothetical protein